MDFFEIVNARRSVRKFQPHAVPRDVLERIVSAGLEAPSGCNVQSKQFIIVDDAETIEAMRAFSRAMQSNPAAVVLLIEPKGTPYGEFWMQDASAAMENMLLATVALGYDACWVEGAIRKHEDALRELLSAPAEYRVWSILPIGKADGEAARPPKPSAAEVTHYNRFGRKA